MPKTDYKYIRFIETEKKPKTSVWECRNKESDFLLGVVKYYGPFRKYSWFPESNTVFEFTCMSNINQFLSEVEEERKANAEKLRKEAQLKFYE